MWPRVVPLAAIAVLFYPLLALAAITPAPTPPGHTASQVHLAYGHDPASSMSVAWASRSEIPAKVEYRPVGDASWRSSASPSSVDSYTSTNNTWYADGYYHDDKYIQNVTTPYPDYVSPFLHNLTLTGLLPAEVYEYKIVGDDAVRTFSTGLVAGAFPKNGKPYVVTVCPLLCPCLWLTSLRTRLKHTVTASPWNCSYPSPPFLFRTTIPRILQL